MLDSDGDGFISNGNIDLMTPAIEIIECLSDFFIQIEQRELILD